MKTTYFPKYSSSWPTRFVRAAVALSLATVALGVGCGQAPKIDSISVTADAVEPLPKGATRQYSAIAHYSDNTTQDISSLVAWQVSADGSISVSNKTGSRGLVTAVNPGVGILSATEGEVTGKAVVGVTDAELKSILVSPPSPVIANGTTVELTATGVYTDLSNRDLTKKVVWTTADAATASVVASGDSGGLLMGLRPGAAEIAASLAGIDGKASVTVTSATLKQLAVTPFASMLAKGTMLQLVATGTFSDNTTQDVTSLAAWTTAAGAVATVSNQSGSKGLVSGISKGPAAIQAAFGGQVSAANLTVTDATLSSITVTPVSPAIASGTSVPLLATGNFSDGTTQDLSGMATWASSAPTIAAVSPVGLASGLGKGQASISAMLTGKTGSTTLTVSSATLSSIQVSAPNSTIALGTSEQYTAVGIYSDGSNQDISSLVTWSSTTASTATVSNASGTKGLVNSVAMGSTSISASLSGVTGSQNLTVSGATLASIMVTPGGAFLAKGTQQSFTATGVFSDGTMQDLTTTVSWSSSTGAVAMVDNSTGAEGLVTAVAAGTSMLTATDAMSGKSGTTRVTVTSAVLVSIAITPSNATIVRATSIQLTATGTYNDGRKQDLTELVTWSSSSPAVVISNATGSEGLAMGLGPDVATITAQLSGKTSTTMLTVTSPMLVSIAVTPMNASLPIGFQQQYVAIGSYSDGSTQDLTFDPSLTWISDGPSAFISNFPPMKGQAFANIPGTVNILATVGPVFGRTMLTVTTARLTSTEIRPATALISAGGTQQFTAVANFDDGSMLDVTGSVFWGSSDPVKVSIDSRGLALASGMVGDAASIIALPTRPPLPFPIGTASVTIN